MEFQHSDIYKFDNLKTKNIDGKRHYVTPEGSYPSVTTVLSWFEKEAIQEWRKRVGEEEANRVSVRAARRGTQIHYMAEDYLSNNPDYAKKRMPADIETFNTIRGILDESVGTVYGLEIPLWSSELRLAGRCDCVAEWNKKPSIIDFKTSRKFKKKEWITKYFEQLSCYSKMFEERTGECLNQIVVVMTVDDNKPLVYIEDRDNYLESAIEKVRRYEEIHAQ